MARPITRTFSLLCFLVASTSAGCATSRSGLDMTGASPAAGPPAARGASEAQQYEDPSLREAHVVRELHELCDASLSQTAVAQSTARTATVRAFATTIHESNRALRGGLAQLEDELGMIELKTNRHDLIASGARDEALALTARRGSFVDRAFLESIVEDHARTVARLERLAGQAQREELRAMIEWRFLPLARKNLARAQEILGSADPEISVAVR